MKVFALGGYGKVGLPAVQLLARSDLVTEIAIAGRSIERAEKMATEIGKKAIAVHVNGTDEEKLTALLAGYDIIMNAASNKTVLPAIRAAMSAGAHYCDVNTTVEPALALASEAEGVDTTLIVATGVAPCISNLMGVYVAEQLEEVEQLQVGITFFVNFQNGQELTPRQWLKNPKESLAVLQDFKPFISWVLQIAQKNSTRTVSKNQDGRWVEIDPVRSGLDVPLTQGGTITSYPYFSGDPIFPSLPRDFSTVSPVELWFSPLPPQLHDLLREHALRVLGGNIDSEMATGSFYDIVEGDPHRWLTLPDDFLPIPKMWVYAVGYKEGRAARCSCWFTAPVWNVGLYFLTSVALAVAVRKILRGEIQERGIMTAERAFEPLPFLDEVASLIPDSLPNGKLIDKSFEWLE
jgi:hypothetical protein